MSTHIQIRKILSIEAIRGLAALYVMAGHIVLIMQPYQFYPGSQFWVKTVFGYGHQAVILFFIVSGFSIHYSSVNSGFETAKQIKIYYYKRFRRIYPLFFIALFFSLLILFIIPIESTWLRNTLSFFMLTDMSPGAISDPIPTNFPIWSLSYEVVYYLLYPLAAIYIKKFGIKWILAYSAMLSLFASVFTLIGWNNHLSNVLQMYWVWIAGAYMGELMLNSEKITIPYFKGWLVMSVACMLTLEKALFFTDWFWAIFFSLLMFSFFFPELENQTFFDRIIESSIVIGTLILCYFLTYFPSIVYHTNLIRIILLVLASCIFVLQFVKIHTIKSIIRKLVNPFVRTGRFSYAIYIFHWPFLLFFSWFFKDLYTDNLWIFGSVILLYLGLVISVSWAAETKLQPAIANFMNQIFYRKIK